MRMVFASLTMVHHISVPAKPELGTCRRGVIPLLHGWKSPYERAAPPGGSSVHSLGMAHALSSRAWSGEGCG
jgi:hypothetical protein